MLKNAKQIVIPEEKNTIDVDRVGASAIIRVDIKEGPIGFVVKHSGLFYINTGIGCNSWSGRFDYCEGSLKDLMEKTPHLKYYLVGD